MQPKLSICILTYNRKEKLQNTLSILKEEYSKLQNKEDIEILISDNHSTDGTKECIEKFILENNLKEWRFNRNNENIGLIGNLLKTEKLSTGKYLWWWGDDDYYLPGILSTVLNHISKCPDYILLNHSAFGAVPGVNLGFESALGPCTESPLKIEKVLGTNYGAIMFISSSIYNKERLTKLHFKDYKINLALPLLYGLFCAASGNYIIDKRIWIDDNYRAISWEKDSDKVFYNYVPYYISLMPEFGYDEEVSRKIYAELFSDLPLRKFKAKIRCFLKQCHCLSFVNAINRLVRAR